MTSSKLDNLVRIGQLNKETGTQAEFNGLIFSLNASTWRVLAKAHEHCNIAEYEGHLEVDEQLLFDLINAAEKVYSSAIAFGPVLDE